MKRKALVFPGQGSQYSGMGKELIEKYETAAATFEEASQVLGFDLTKMCLEGSREQLNQTEITQPAILTTSVAMYRVLKETMALKPQYFAGHSLGEITALTCAGAITFPDALRIVQKRGQLMKEASLKDESMMIAVTNLSCRVIEEECHKYQEKGHQVYISNYNSSEQTVLSGAKDAVLLLKERLLGFGADVRPLNVSAPFHTPFMQNVADKMKLELSKYNYYDPKYPVISNVDGQPYFSKNDIIDKLTRQITAPVQWTETMNYLKKEKTHMTLEIGPSNVLRNILRGELPSINSFALDNREDRIILEKFIRSDYNVPFLSRSLGLAVATKNNNDNVEEYQEGVVKPYKKIEKIQRKIEEESREATAEEMNQAIDMLLTVFLTKKVSLEEQQDRFKTLFFDSGTEELFIDFDVYQKSKLAV